MSKFDTLNVSTYVWITLTNYGIVIAFCEISDI